MEYIKITSKDEIYPKQLLKIENYPKQLYICGNYKLLTSENIFAIVGSRDCTEYGRKQARCFAKELSKSGICIISGMAIGIDTAAHLGAIEEKGKTIAVLGGGFNYIYPKENEWLFNKIINNNGCVITEHNIEKEAKLSNFPKRNRIISGISNGVLVIEAKNKSGSMITARYAVEQKKALYAIPSNIDSRNGIGTNKLIQNGAILTIDFNQIIDKFNLKKAEDIENISKIDIPKEYEEVYKAIKEGISYVNDIKKKTGKEVNEINSILTMLELEGYIKQTAGNEFIVKGD